MKRQITIWLSTVLMFLFAQSAPAFPGEHLPYRMAHFADRIAFGIDRHVIHPVTHGIARRLR